MSYMYEPSSKNEEGNVKTVTTQGLVYLVGVTQVLLTSPNICSPY